ncbi:MAG TPA: hypothetical protein VF735_03270 [Pyrinomonadaceae bacterium]|jgi:hypothetical protein
MELELLCGNIVTENWRGAEIQINRDAFTPEFWRATSAYFKTRFTELARQYKGKTKGRRRAKSDQVKLDAYENLALTGDVEREVFAELLTRRGSDEQAPVLAGWNVTHKGEPVPATKESLLRLPPRAVFDLWEFCREKSSTVKKRVEAETETATTDETIEDI